MKFMTFSILALSTMAATASAQQLAEQPTPELFVASDALEVNGQDYRKLSVDNLSEAAELHAGDEVFKNAFSNVSKATGLIFVTVKSPADAKAVAKELKLEVVFAQGESAVFKASEGQDLLGISDYLNADSRVKASKIELNSGKYRAQ
ncbi:MULTISPECIES: hypothetical protein [Vibrio]|jgi:hypothetical protein|uniref:ASP external chaperone domain-containing protein n=2 Tax=Vibrio TaxID=662 RepID=A0ABW7J9S0_9VIBR|nr:MULTISPECIES: hypothetical protein [Vibrio]KIP67140.1 hypothetical protein SN10_21725 [Vibrio harveyi]KIP78916.1 hypothetical protein SN11_04250 [Vibrio harveyi]PAW08763.1 hypothetical protein B6K85_20715 [Vibrio sp. V1B]CAH1525644.1 conserved exported hypothetical protein [Vibrio jasicida]CAH1609384.1 conserved exported hypothetical protein [Vibrio jasicida]